MKILSLCLLAGVLTFFSGCAGESGGYYTPSQIEAQHAGYDPTAHTYGTRY